MNSIDTRQRILDAASSLFKQKGYAAVGVREIAKAAGVKVAMISYYFEGKVGILKTIMQDFSNRYLQVLEDIDEKSKSLEECMRILISNLIYFIRENTNLALVFYNELFLDLPELSELKSGIVTQIMQRMNKLIRRFGYEDIDNTQITTICLNLFVIIFSSFRSVVVLKDVLDEEPNDEQYDRFAETITTLFLEGTHGLVAKDKIRRKREKK